MLYKAKGNPGHLRSGDRTHSITLSKRTIVAGRRASLPNGTTLYDHSSGQPRDEGNQIYDKDSVEISIPTDQSFLDASSVKWVDSRPIRGEKFLTCFLVRGCMYLCEELVGCKNQRPNNIIKQLYKEIATEIQKREYCTQAFHNNIASNR